MKTKPGEQTDVSPCSQPNPTLRLDGTPCKMQGIFIFILVRHLDGLRVGVEVLEEVPLAGDGLLQPQLPDGKI